MQDEDSSSARDSSFLITNICNTFSGLIKITNSEKVSFLTRSEYLFNDDSDLERFKKDIGTCLNEEQLSLLLKAVRAYSAELIAKKYLARAENSRYQLTIKLKKKSFNTEEIDMALNYLAERKILEDFRYANAWLNTRRLAKKEGRLRLASELASRGIEAPVAKKALDVFFEENPEQEICSQALDKQLRKGLNGVKLLRAMTRLGFSVSLVNICLEGKKGNIG